MSPSSGSRRIRVLEINKYYSETTGGVERVVEALARGLAASGIQVRVLTCGRTCWRTTVRRECGVVVVRAASPITAMSMPVSMRFITLFSRLSRWADVIHWHEPFPLASSCALLQGAGKKTIITWHSDIIRQRWARQLVLPTQRRVVRNAWAVVATSPELVRNSEVLRELQNVKVIPLGIADQAPGPAASDEATWRSRWGINHRYVLFVGRLVYYKGIEVLAQAMALSGVALVAVGQGPLAAVLRSASQQSGTRLKIIEEPVSDADLWQFYRHCEFLVFPSTHSSEAFGLVQLEAMRCGKPVVNTNLPTGVPYVSIHGVTGITVPVGDPNALAQAMDRLWNEHAARDALGLNARRRYKDNFEDHTMVRSYMGLIEEAAGGNTRRSASS